MTNSLLTGKASIDRPWMSFYPEDMQNIPVPQCSVTEFLKKNNPDFNKLAIEYYGRSYTWNDIWTNVDATAKSLRALGFEVGDRIPVFLQAVPEFLILLLAAEKIGVALVCRDDIPDEIAFAIRKAKSSVVFAHDFISKEEEDKYLAETPMKRIVKVSPYTFADKASIPEHVKSQIDAKYPEHLASNPDNMSWEEFIALGEDYNGEIDAFDDPTRPLLCAYTSGSTGISKLVIHSADNIVGIIFQMGLFAPHSDVQQTWLHTLLPTALIAVTVSMILFPLSTGKLLMLDPFCSVEDIDLEFMRYKPNFWAAIPMFFHVLMNSERIPADYSMDHFYAAGVGAESMTNKQIRKVQKFLKDHNCPAFFSVGYGQSEGGSNFTLPCPYVPLKDGCQGIPMIHTNLGVFAKDSYEELSYGEIGEICKTGPGNMLGYQNADHTERTLQHHPDGKVWLHTGDFGYITEQGILYVLGRGLPERFGGGYLFLLTMENRVVEVPGVEDGFFCLVPDKEHEGYFLTYLFVILEEGKKLEEVKEGIYEVLEPYEKPVEITVIKERPYFHFKTNRKELTAAILNR